MRRDDAFAQVRPEGTWALADWRVPGSDNRYTTAVDVVVEVLREIGPLDYEHLRDECQQRYPVSEWRITQCLSSNLIGINGEGLYDLAERGATPIEDSEPKKPRNIEASGNVVGIELTVDSELLRGSGIPVHRWLTWYLKLRTAPSTRHFDLGKGSIDRRAADAGEFGFGVGAEVVQLEEVVLGLRLARPLSCPSKWAMSGSRSATASKRRPSCFSSCAARWRSSRNTNLRASRRLAASAR